MRELPASERFDRIMNEVVLGMVCDGNGAIFRCGLNPTWAPWVIVPAVTIGDPPRDYRPLRVMTAVHYCDAHFLGFDLAAYLDTAIRRRIEDLAARGRAVGFRCDFEAARVERMRIDTPEYRTFMATLATKRRR
jgi:hypothetical protein